MADGDLTRRRFLRRTALVGAGIAVPLTSGYVGYRLPRGDDASAAEPQPPAQPDGVHHFRSRPDLRPPKLTITEAGTPPAEPEYLFLSPKAYQASSPSQPGCAVIDRRGRPIWFLPREGPDLVPMDFTVQTYRGEPVLTWWQGKVLSGYGHGAGIVYDRSYQQIAEVRMGGGKQADLHEFLITEDDTALLMAYHPVRTDLTSIGGAADGWVHAGIVQEVDIASGDVLFEWNSLDHIAVDETYQDLGDSGTEEKPFDYIHLNSIEPTGDGGLVLSARNTWALYRISRSTGEVDWRMHGRKSDFELEDLARFSWQHDARLHSNDRLALFDNSSSPPQGPHSRGLVLRVDYERRTVAVENEFVHPARLRADNQGSMQLREDGGALVGWGSQPYTSEFDSDAELVFDSRFPEPDQSYRARTLDWVGTPAEKPAIAVGSNTAGGRTVYVSWNGSTEVAQWRVLAGESRSSLETVATAPRSGFETAVVAGSEGPYFAAIALDEQGEELAQSDPVRE
ncbi:ArsR family transcriptional regulator [Saccharomonospora piscinae]|uniref:ArsR family transcriptional regulator n=1 Tax=Saccharomonospora piscinae TaxID=687388 RepID=A0A1V9AA31_SACPI|nr:arylsulfotransferase family protein [Saccharomonospora piscinae]OQO93931.1 ArsR family transcriptional regulator [Saccharomonospora piscinae]TLW95102.1 ArsR family transcriptional regulator [Saccharomonospora piscinae]